MAVTAARAPYAAVYGDGITPPSFIAWSLGILGLVDAVILITTPWRLTLLACILLFGGGRRAAARAGAAPHADATRTP
ncbi:hypothetical protein [Streptomyces platensis]|uniref:hypothetical protein n=1 Tax=Streptomyces platensis TaxID=58346 RepID=UPI00332AA49A